MNLRKLILAGAAGAALMGVPAQASIIDNPQFRVLGLVIVWGADGATGTTPVVSDFIIDDAAGAGDTDLIAGDVHAVITGTLSPVPAGGAVPDEGSIVDSTGTLQTSTGLLDALGDFDAFTLTDTTDIALNGLTQNTSFFIASNTNFSINGEASLVTDPTTTDFDLTDIGFSMGVAPVGAVTVGGLTYGGNAQDPQGSFPLPATATLDDMPAGTLVYDGSGGRLTAASVGSIADQSVRFDAVYTLGGAAGYDLSQGNGAIEAQVEYTVFVP